MGPYDLVRHRIFAMTVPVSEWTESDVLTLPAESDSLERKGSALLDLTLRNADREAILNELAKQLSAFANSGGGELVYGLTDAGRVDNGGVERIVKGRQSTREWLEDVIPTLVDPPLLGWNVYEIKGSGAGSLIDAGKSLFVVSIPDSAHVPHQSRRDLRYYVRLGGKSHPATNRIIEDIRNRIRHPIVEVRDVEILDAEYDGESSGESGSLEVNLEFKICNTGAIRAEHVCLQIDASSDIFVSSGSRELTMRQGSKPGLRLLELQHTLYPQLDVHSTVGIALPALVWDMVPTLRSAGFSIGGKDPAEAILLITIFADSAPARFQQFRLVDIDPKNQLSTVIPNFQSRVARSRPFRPARRWPLR